MCVCERENDPSVTLHSCDRGKPPHTGPCECEAVWSAAVCRHTHVKVQFWEEGEAFDAIHRNLNLAVFLVSLCFADDYKPFPSSDILTASLNVIIRLMQVHVYLSNFGREARTRTLCVLTWSK